MSSKLKKTRPELLKQRRALTLFKRYLPTLVLKKQQIQMEILKVRTERGRLLEEMKKRISKVERWVPLFSEMIPGPVTELVRVRSIQRGEKNVAGIVLPTVKDVSYEVKPYSRYFTPPWTDLAVDFVKALLELRERTRILTEQERLLQAELRKVTQRVNLFEKVMIPRTVENTRLIRIHLGEEQVAGVGRAKIAKSKTVESPAGMEVQS